MPGPDSDSASLNWFQMRPSTGPPPSIHSSPRLAPPQRQTALPSLGALAEGGFGDCLASKGHAPLPFLSPPFTRYTSLLALGSVSPTIRSLPFELPLGVFSRAGRRGGSFHVPGENKLKENGNLNPYSEHCPRVHDCTPRGRTSPSEENAVGEGGSVPGLGVTLTGTGRQSALRCSVGPGFPQAPARLCCAGNTSGAVTRSPEPQSDHGL